MLDTNMVVRYLIQDDDKQARLATKLFEACSRGDVSLVLLPEVLAECIFVLHSFYKLPRENVSRSMAVLITSPGIELDNAEIYLDALGRYRETNVHVVDCILAAFAAARALPVATFDGDFRKFKDVNVKVD